MRFDNLGLRYPQASQWALHKVNFELAPARRLACGRTGAGKSSLLGAAGHVPCLPGEIYYGEQPLSRLAPEAVRDLYDTVSQIPLTFFGTLRANLAPLTEHDDAALELALARSAGRALRRPAGRGARQAAALRR